MYTDKLDYHYGLEERYLPSLFSVNCERKLSEKSTYNTISEPTTNSLYNNVESMYECNSPFLTFCSEYN